RAHHRRRYPYLPGLQPHRAGAGTDAAGGRAEAGEGDAARAQAPRPPLADPARPLCLPGAPPRLPGLRGRRSLPLQGEDHRHAVSCWLISPGCGESAQPDNKAAASTAAATPPRPRALPAAFSPGMIAILAAWDGYFTASCPAAPLPPARAAPLPARLEESPW